MMGLCREESRLPMTPMDEHTRSKLRGALEAYGLLA